MSNLEIRDELRETGNDARKRGKKPAEAKRTDADRGQASLDAIHADAELVRRCVAGDVAGWEELYERCHPPLLRSIEHILGATRSDPNLVDELAARVWYALVADDGRLLAKFDIQRGARLGTFLRCIAKDVTSRHLRSEFRRQRRERAAGKRRQRKTTAAHADADMADFLDTLSASDQQFVDQHLLGGETIGQPSPEVSATSIWKRASRIRQKIRRFFQSDPHDA